MSLAPEWMRRSRVFVRSPGGRVAEGIDITDSLGGSGVTFEKCGTCRALLADAADLTFHLTSWHPTLALTTHNHNTAYAPIAHTTTNHPHGPVAGE